MASLSKIFSEAQLRNEEDPLDTMAMQALVVRFRELHGTPRWIMDEINEVGGKNFIRGLKSVQEQGHDYIVASILTQPGVMYALHLRSEIGPILDLLEGVSPSAQAASFMAEDIGPVIGRGSRLCWEMIKKFDLRQKAVVYSRNSVLFYLYQNLGDGERLQILDDVEAMSPHERFGCLKAPKAVQSLDRCAKRREGHPGDVVFSMFKKYDNTQLQEAFACPDLLCDFLEHEPRAYWALERIKQFTPLGQAQALGQDGVIETLRYLEQNARREGRKCTFPSQAVLEILNSAPFQKDSCLRDMVINENLNTILGWGYQRPQAKPVSVRPSRL